MTTSIPAGRLGRASLCMALALAAGACDDVQSPETTRMEPAAAAVTATAGFQMAPEAIHLEQVGSMWKVRGEQVDARGNAVEVKTTFSSSATSVVSVDSKGWIKAKSQGRALIVGTYGGAKDTTLVIVGPAATSLFRITTEEDSIPAVGGTVKLTTEILDTEGVPVGNPLITWETSTPHIVSVTGAANGTVTALALGQGIVIAKHGNRADTATVWVGPKPPRLVATPSSMLLDQVGSMWFIRAEHGSGSAMTAVPAQFKSTKTSVVTVSKDGWVKAAGQGKAAIIATYNGQADTVPVQVGNIPTGSFAIRNPVDSIAAVGGTVRVNADAQDPSGNPILNPRITWTSATPGIATVSGTAGTATVTAKALGQAIIVATRGTFTDTAVIRVGNSAVVPPTPALIDVTPSEDTIPTVGGAAQLQVTARDAQGKLMSGVAADWVSLDPAIADVGTGGKSETRTVKGLKRGKARIVASANGAVDTAVVHVEPTTANVTWTLAHAPTSPTTATPVTIDVTSSDPSVVATIALSIDGATVKSCSGGSCSWTGALTAGSHTYSATATLVDGTKQNAGSGTVAVAQPQPGNKAGYSKTSPHWRHMRTSTVDYRIHYQKGAQQVAEYDWAAGHFDHVTGGNLNEYKSRNPSIKHFTYDTYWFVPVNNAGPAEAWLAANGYNVENAYLHVAGTSKTKANRIMKQQYAGRDYWYYNVGDPGFQAWRRATTRQQTSVNNKGFASDGLFLDTNSRNTVRKYVPPTSLEYGSYAQYFLDFDALLASHRAWVPAGYLILNQSTYFNKADEQDLSKIAGGTMLEFVNGPYRDPQWAAVDQAIANGVVVEYGTAIKANHKGNVRYGVTPGNYKSIVERVLMWEYASYLMVVNPNHMDRLYFEPYLGSWDSPMTTVWLEAFEQDIGLATATRSVLTSGKDGAGQTYQVFQRQFENALVLIRPQGSKGSSGNYEYGDNSAVTVTLPPGTWRMLLADGTVTGPVTSVKLRCGEAVIFMK